MRSLPLDPDEGPPGSESLNAEELRARLREAEETLDAIRNGEVDAVVIGGPAGQQVYTLENADRPYRVLIEQMQEGAVTLSADGTLLYCNQRLASLLGRAREPMLGQPMSRFFHAADRKAFFELLGGSVGRSAELTLMTGGGRQVPVNLSLVDLAIEPAMPRVVCGIVTDLTHSRERNHELAAANTRLAEEIDERRRAEDSLHLALDAAGMGSWDMDLVNGVTRRSLRHDQIFGHPQLLRTWDLQGMLQRFVPEDREAVALAFSQAPRTGAIDFEKRITRASDGEERWVHLRGRVYYSEGEAVRLTGVTSDITERRQIEEQLRQAQKMEAVGQLTGGIAHDFNNLLMVIGGSLDLLNRLIGTDDKTRRIFQAARQGVERGAKLNQQLLAFARRQDLRAETICIADLIPTFQHLLDRALSETVVVQIDSAAHPWFCETDPLQLETAILNLAINARDAMPNGGTLTLATANRSLDARTAAAWGAHEGDYVLVSVRDTGSGMSADVASRAFEPFFTTKEVGKGTGLGLSQVYGFAKQGGGFIRIDSKLGLGTTVEIYVPRVQSPAAGPAADRGAAAAVDNLGAAAQVGGQGIILVVEDDASVRITTSGLLRDLGYAVREAENAAAALALIDRGEHLDLVFTDVVMPGGMSGIELAKRIQTSRPELPVLLTSGYTPQHFMPQAAPDGLPLLRKPYAQADLSRAIQEAMPRSRRPLRPV